MPNFKVNVTWSCWGQVNVEANSLEEAINKVRNNLDDYPLPQGEYIEDSFEVDELLYSD